MHYDTRLMTMRNRLLFIVLIGLTSGTVSGEETGRPVRTAPDQPGLGAGSSPISPTAPKRRFNERVTFHEIDPLLPEKPRKKSVEPQLEPESRSQSRTPRPLDPRTDAPRRPPPEPPTQKEIQEALRAKNWLDPSKFDDSSAKEERQRIDEAMGLGAEEEEEDPSSPTANEDDPNGKPATFGDFFDRVREEAMALARVENGEEDPDGEEEKRLKDEQDKKTAAEEREDKRALRLQAESGVGSAFSPLESKAATETARPSSPTAAEPTRAGEPASPSFTPVFATSQTSRSQPSRELSTGLTRTNEEPATGRSSASVGLATPGLGQESAAPRPTSIDPVTGSFRQMDLRDYRDTRMADSPRTSGNPTGLQDEGNRFRDNGGPSSARPGNGGLGGLGFAPTGFAGTDSGTLSPRRTSIAPQAGTGFQSGFSALRSAAILPPSVGMAEPGRADRWEKDRMKSQLLGDAPPSGFGARKP